MAACDRLRFASINWAIRSGGWTDSKDSKNGATKAWRAMGPPKIEGAGPSKSTGGAGSPGAWRVSGVGTFETMDVTGPSKKRGCRALRKQRAIGPTPCAHQKHKQWSWTLQKQRWHRALYQKWGTPGHPKMGGTQHAKITEACQPKTKRAAGCQDLQMHGGHGALQKRGTLAKNGGSWAPQKHTRRHPGGTQWHGTMHRSCFLMDQL